MSAGQTNFETSAAPSVSGTAAVSEHVGGRKQFSSAAQHSGVVLGEAAAADMYKTSSMGGGIVDAEHHMYHENGTRKLTSKKMVTAPH
eukprot:CAMPEP_0179884022 /NCGR_PEP_ID=MMETSP0982-20121206/29132_1 /TAXON_ID=483367 /ORGANISM="non described non described, Strain CCMP 2436" /LENGTH=87 /DNA_ID=CAMNT_0021778721 /DNA_START=53 /DNA_END=316 /DNA_ORIENTATION=-